MQSQSVARKKKKKKPLRFTATCATGLEVLVGEEIECFGGKDLETHLGAVSWSGNLESGYRACLWSRFASRILLELSRFDAPDTDALYNQAGKILWDEHFSGKTTFAVHATLANAAITHSQFAALRIKDGIVDQFRRRFGSRPDVDAFNPGIRINLHVQGTGGSLSLDLSGDSLHRRGYRTGSGEAPLKETLAAAIVHLSGWPQRAKEENILLDPMCGSGTLLIEAALMLSQSAPGLQRKKFGFMAWNKHDPALWERLVQEALDRENQALPDNWPRFIGYDADPAVVAVARKNVIAAGMRDIITIRYRQLAQLQSPGPRGCLITNPPYGERLSEKEAVKYLYRCLGRVYQERFAGWSLGFFTANADLADMVAMHWLERHRLYNGPLKCQLLVGTESEVKAKPLPRRSPQALEKGAPGEDFANRLRKNYAALLPWLDQKGISCYRLYNQDLPDYNLAIDVYEDWFHVQEYAAPAEIDQEKTEQRFKLALQILRTVFDIPRSQIYIKTRQAQKGKQQYQKRPSSGTLSEVREQGKCFLVNFTDYLDTGLFLDHRPTRAYIEQLAKGKTFLNLFGYTGSATVYAAAGGASSTTTVDLSETYLERCRANLSLNGFGGPLHQTVNEDCLEWLKKSEERYGLIFLDPPTFSNARHQKRTFEVQKDHATLLRLAMQRLTREGLLLFSTNFRSFELDEQLSREYQVEEITKQTIPQDFQRKRPIHRCWEFRRRQDKQDNQDQQDKTRQSED